MKKTIILPVAFTTEDCCTPEFIKLSLTPEIIAKCKRMMKLAKDEGLDGINIDLCAEYFGDEECTEKSDFRSNVNYLCVSAERIYFYAQSKHESSVQFESPEFSAEIFA